MQATPSSFSSDISIAHLTSLTYATSASDDRTPFLVERDAKLIQDIKEITALIEGAQRLVRRVETDGARLLNWFPSVLRHLLHTRLVGPIPSASENSYFRQATEWDSGNQHQAVLRVLVMLEILDWSASVLEDADARTQSSSRNALSEIARKRILTGELIRILVASEDLQEVLEQELADLREDRKRLRGATSRSPRSPEETYLQESITSYAHPLLDRSVPATNARHSTRPDLVWMQTTLAPSVLTHSRQRAHSFPLALGLLARSVIMGTITPSRIRSRAKSLGDALPSD